jgi:hypothetical protein
LLGDGHREFRGIPERVAGHLEAGCSGVSEAAFGSSASRPADDASKNATAGSVGKRGPTQTRVYTRKLLDDLVDQSARVKRLDVVVV